MVQNLPKDVLKLLLMKSERETLHALKDAMLGLHDTPPVKPSDGSGKPRRLRKLQQAHHGNRYNSLKKLFDMIEIAH